jgi:hypothetical protein
MIRKLLLRIGNRQVRQLRWPLLIVLALSSLGCARGDWTSETLTLVDVTGTWEGLFRHNTGFLDRTHRWTLQQKGGKVIGEVLEAGHREGSIEGLVSGEIFRFKLNRQGRDTSSLSYSGEATVTVDEISGQSAGLGCPCTFVLRRVSTEAIRAK